MDERQQELMYKFAVFEQQVNQLQQQLEAIEKGIVELQGLNIGLDELKGATGKEVMAQIGRGIFLKTKLLSEELLVNIGEKNLVKKTIPETKELIENQIVNLSNVKKELDKSMENLGRELREMMKEGK